MMLLLAPGLASADWPAGTFSIAAFDSATGEVGVAVQSRVFGVGPRVAWVKGGVGAIATQAQSNESFGPRGLALLESGLSAQRALDMLIAGDTLRDFRQVGIVDANGTAANWTGLRCMSWAGDSAGASFTCQGNILVSEAVVSGMVAAFRSTNGPLAHRMIAALEAAQAAGGDSRGQQSAALLIGRAHPDYPEYVFRYADVRVDDHPQPIAELRRLFEIYESQGLLQANLRFAEWLDARGDSVAADRERAVVGRLLERALARDVQDPEVLNSLAWLSATNDIHLDAALEAAKRAVALSPEDSNILDTLAEVHFRLGDFVQAVAVERRALALKPGDAYLQEQLARFLQGRR
jgi:uncharacterized Ntn-hydrolase superfamily protein